MFLLGRPFRQGFHSGDWLSTFWFSLLLRVSPQCSISCRPYLPVCRSLAQNRASA